MIEKSRLSKDSYKGVRDLYPEDMALQKYIFEVWRKVSERFGYSEYSASILESAELYEAKTSEEIVSEQTYTFKDRGDRRVTLRPEMTPSVARMVAAKRRELSFPLRWYSIQNMFRYERPQKGRLREHWQLNADIFGVPDPYADAEIISLAYAIMREFGASDNQFVIKVSSRAVLDNYLSEQGLNENQKKSVMKTLDKKGKIENLDEQMEKAAGKVLDFNEMDQNLATLNGDLGFEIETDMSIVRGFDYYTGMVFEVFDTSGENNRSLFGGGRYDNLLEIFGSDAVPAVGFGMGDVTIADFLSTHNLLPEYSYPTSLLIMSKSDEEFEHAKKLADTLREERINVALNNGENTKIDTALKHADRSGILYFILIGPEEIKSESYRIRDVKSGKESVAIAPSKIAEHILTPGE
jgi:histidyl-tRNA synthetase